MRSVLVVSHADADGHVIAEQVRRNLAAVPTFDVRTIVDAQRTKDHRTWKRLTDIPEIDEAEFVVFVDLMFAPASFAEEADALLHFAKQRPGKQFVVLDHHPLPLRRLYSAANLHPIYRADVLDCTIGATSSLMVLAALLEAQPSRVKEKKRPEAIDLVKGIRRAAAPGGPLVGEKLLTLIHFQHWSELIELGREDARLHRLPRGRRVRGDKLSDVLKHLDAVATDLLTRANSRSTRTDTTKGSPMSYDFEMAVNLSPPTPSIVPSDRRDLEAIVTLLELAAICLTTAPGTEFTSEQLIAEAKHIGGSEIDLDEKDVRIVLSKAGFLKKQGSRYSLK